MRFADTTDNDNIVKIIKEFGAISKETAITLEQVIDKGIQDGLCEIYPRGGKDGHPWYPRVSLIMGVKHFARASRCSLCWNINYSDAFARAY